MKRKNMLFLLAMLGFAQCLWALPVTSGLVLNLDADNISGAAVAADGTIDTWADVSGMGNDATQANATFRPILVQANQYFKGHNTVWFDGSNDWMTLNSSMINVGSFTMFAVAKYDRTNGIEQYIINGQDPASPNGRIRFCTNTSWRFLWRAGNASEVTTPSDTNKHLFTLTSTMVCQLDGSSVGTGTNTSTENPLGFNIGSYDRGASHWFQGHMAAVIIYNRVLSSEEIASVNSYLYTKYMVGVSSPSPEDGAVAVGAPVTEDNVTVTLQWDAAPNPENPATVDPAVKKHVVYVSGGTTDPNMYLTAEINVTDYNSLTTTTAPLTLAYDQTYTWRVDEVLSDGNGGVLLNDDPNNYVGTNWTFSTLLKVPVITSQPVSVKFIPGESVNLNADYTSLSQATAQWYKNSQPVTLDSRITVSSDSDSTTLTIQDMVVGDEGDYYCVLTSDAGPTTSGTATLVAKKLLASYAFEQNLEDGIGVNDGAAIDNPVFIQGIVGSYAVETADGLGYVLLTNNAYPKAGFGNGLDQFTCTFWANPSSLLTGDGRIIGDFNNGSTTGMQIGISGDGSIRTYIRDDRGVSAELFSAANTIPDGQWSQVAVSYDGSNLRYFVNGSMIRQQAVATLTSFSDWQYPMTYLAKNSRGSIVEHYRGGLDDLRIYNYPMDEFQVADIYVDVTGKPVCIESMRPNAMFDINGDCSVDLKDFAELAQHWLESAIYSSSN